MLKLLFSILTVFQISYLAAQSISSCSNLKDFTDIVNKVVRNEKTFKITHSLSQIIEPGNTVACNQNGMHYENSYYRVFDLTNEFNLNGDWIVQNIEIAIEQAESGNGISQPAKLMLYVMSEYKNKIIPDSLALLIDTIEFDVYDNESGTIKNIEIPEVANVVTGKSLVVEVLIPDGQSTENSLFLGSNGLGETDSTYIKASHCGINTPVPMSEIMFPNVHLIMNIYGIYTDPNPEITTFQIDGQLTETEIVNDIQNNIYTVHLIMPAGTSLNALSPDIQIPAGFQIIPASGETVDFSEGPVIYNVNNNFLKISREWTVSVNNAGPEIIALSIAGQNGETVIDTFNRMVAVPVPFGTDLSNITPNITVYEGFNINPPSAVSQDFSTGPVSYTVSHETLPLTQDWLVEVYESGGTSIEQSVNGEIIIFPNPSKDVFCIKGINYQYVEVFNHDGRLIQYVNAGEDIYLTHVPSGIYYIKIFSDSTVDIKKIIRN